MIADDRVLLWSFSDSGGTGNCTPIGKKQSM